MSVRWLSRIALLLAAAFLVIIVLHHGSGYKVRMLMSNANDLRIGSQVKIGGVPVGSVTSLGLGAGDQVVAGMKLNRGYHITNRGSAAIVPVDLLGSVYVALTPGRGTAEPSGATIPASKVTYPVELDQVLNVLDAQTRDRLGILIDATGTALTGRGTDFNEVLGTLPRSLSDGSQVLGQLVSDNHTLGNLVQHSSRFVAALIPQQHQLTALINRAGRTMSTTAAHQADLKSILDRAPATLQTAQRFLADLRSTTIPLKPAAQDISAVAPELDQTLAAIPSFQRAANPTLATARQAAPKLTELADGVNPVVLDAKPTVSELTSFASTSSPATYALSESIDNALGLIEGWARSIQTSDGIGHVFHGRALVGPELIRSLAGQVSSSGTLTAAQRHHAKTAKSGSATAGVPTLTTPAATSPPPSPASSLSNTLSNVSSTVSGVVSTLGNTVAGVTGAAGGNSGRSVTGTSTTSTTSTTGSLTSLLNYLLKP